MGNMDFEYKRKNSSAEEKENFYPLRRCSDEEIL
jgi:hypothetical protein